MATVKWLTTAPNPRVKATGPDAGQRGWKLHAIITDSDSFEEIRRQHALCGLRPAHGWGLDLFIEDKCQRCLSKIVCMIDDNPVFLAARAAIAKATGE